MNEHASHPDPENLCRRCGKCCYAKMIVDEEIIYTPYPCHYLDVETNLCTVYDRRHEMNVDCLTREEAIELGVFPADCPYVKGLPNYKPPREHWTDVELELFNESVEDDYPHG